MTFRPSTLNAPSISPSIALLHQLEAVLTFEPQPFLKGRKLLQKLFMGTPM